ncbi:MAG TPA: TRAM domain-containing protein [Planctomycetota bacterium]|nr:TRAM domain-containing protein [Planctomycetota bacterium]
MEPSERGGPAGNPAPAPGESAASGEPASGAAKGAGADAGAPPRKLLGSPQGGGWSLRASRITGDVRDRIAIFAVRACFFLACAGLGVAGVREIAAQTGRTDIGYFEGVIIALATAVLLIGLEIVFTTSSIRIISAITFGLGMGLILSLVFQPVVELIVIAVAPEGLMTTEGLMTPSFLRFLHVLTTTIFCYYGITILLRTKDDFKFIIPYVEFRKDVKARAPILFDTSCFVDGRIQPLLATGVFDQRLVVPTFVLKELQMIADSAERSLRERGRRGMDILAELEREYHPEIIDRPLASGESVDDALIRLAVELGGKVVTTDFNLQKNARLQGVRILNVNDLATALKPAFVPGETMRVRLLREGDDKGQAVGFLRDGTMVVVEGARSRIGQEVTLEVTSSLQTNAGKMVFGRLRRADRGDGEP